MNKKTLLLLGFIILKFVLQYSLITDDYDLQRDEYLHLDQARHLAWGYLSVPPFTSWVSYFIYLLGNSVFWIKFFPALFGALTIVVVWKAIEELKGSLFALVLGATCVFFSALLRLNTLYQPNSFDVLCWTTFYFILIKYINSKNTKWLFILAIIFAFGFLNKYNIGFLIIGLIPAILLTQERKIFTQPKLYVALVLGLLLIAPNLLWQYTNGFPVIHHMKELAETQLVNVDRLEFLKSQVLFFIGSFIVIVSGCIALLLYKPFQKYRLFFWSIIFTLAVFMYLKAKDYYAIGLYPIYISFGSVYLAEQLKEGWKRYLQPVLIILPILFFIPMYNAFFPNKSPEYIVNNAKAYQKFGLLRWEDGKDHLLPQDFADMLGWKELAVKVDSVAGTLPDLEHTLILCDNYGQAGAINYYTTNKKVVAHSFNADYINWLPLDMKIKDVILVKEDNDDDKERKTEIPLFDTVYLAAKRINKFAREPEISIYVLRGAKVDVSKRIKDEMESKLKEGQ
ncbi:glycosyltransferase family 39 protein [Flavobacterium sp. A45]|uniref:glycosyltransferase family 39 protein n=1 Tax=Flavobacterium sp. A45 TaxID=1945862 RepID=UPI000984C0B8|nr:glycosyltransferase family 39 protein [Flavobacterium sp. A45]OOG76981.1 glycosyl transferase [Flavobacterium sp. A45]